MTASLTYGLIGALIVFSIYVMVTGRSKDEAKEWGDAPDSLSHEFRLDWYKDALAEAIRQLEIRDGVIRDLKQQLVDQGFEIRVLQDDIENHECQAINASLNHGPSWAAAQGAQ